MTEFVIAAAAMLCAFVPIGILAWRGGLMDAVVAYEAASSIIVMVFILLPEGFGRPSEFEFPVLFAVLLLGSGLVFIHALERWL
jgi:hypothetical protein